MFLPPAIGSQLARQRHHDLQAQGGQQRLLHQLRQHAAPPGPPDKPAGGSPSCSSAPAQPYSPDEPQPSCQQSPKAETGMATLAVLAAIRSLPWRTWGRFIWVLPVSAVLVLAACSGGLGSPALAWPVIWQQLPPVR